VFIRISQNRKAAGDAQAEARELTQMGCLAPALFKHVFGELLEAFDEHVITLLLSLHCRL